MAGDTTTHYSPNKQRHTGSIARCTAPECARWRVAGVGPDAPTETNERGASQSQVEYHFDSIDARALLELARVHAQGDTKYGRDNWRGIAERDHINHALIHLYAYLAGDTQDDHLAHALCRTEMALAIRLQGGPQ